MNFKAWRGIVDVPLAPITLLLGRNSAGKTSLIQSLLLLKQSVEEPDSGQPLRFGGDAGAHVSLGGFADAIHQHKVRRQLGLGVTFNPRGGKRSSRWFERAEDNATKPRAGPRPLLRGEVEFEALYSSGGDNAELDWLTYRSSDLDLRFRATSAGWSVRMNSKGHRPARSVRLPRREKPVYGVAFPGSALLSLGPHARFVEDACRALLRELRGMAYLGPLRPVPRRYLHSDGTRPRDIGTMGEKAYHYLLEGIDATKGHLARSTENATRWLRVLGLIESEDELCAVREAAGLYEMHLHRGGNHDAANYVALADLGFGVSQVLPVVVLAEFLEPGRTALIEQPEIHLHPAAQSSLADLFVEAAHSRGVQFIVETHSEHLFRRLQTLIATRKVHPAMCKAYFVDRVGGRSLLNELKVDEYGQISNWPENFFGDAVGETERHMLAVLKRKSGHA